jgi:hypothetical protein
MQAATVFLAGIVVLAFMSLSSFAASEFEGKWNVQDSKGKPFEVTLSADGSANANLPGKPLSGTWKEEDGAAVISWDSGWITKISKQGDKFKKTAWEKGKPLSSAPTSSSDAKKVD